jgi:GH15 family glucan-1,4-alpha-glucosidase
LLQPEFLDHETGLLKASRDISERNEALGIRPGYDVAHQTFGIVGLDSAAWLAQRLSDDEHHHSWSLAASRMRGAFLAHKSHSLIAGSRIIKRRLLTGEVQEELLVERKQENEEFLSKFLPNEMPLSNEGQHLLEPDTSQCFPIIYGIVDLRSDIAINTMKQLETLWSQAWEGGGYGRYDISGEPDSPGPWALATCFMAQAYFEMGDVGKATRALKWLLEKAGSSGAWFEFYGVRPTPPLPPVGILVWAWAQFISLIVKQVLGAQVENGLLKLSPRIDGIEAHLRFGNE